MQRVVSFYEKLPRGSASEVKPRGLIARYQAKHFGKNASAARKYTFGYFVSDMWECMLSVGML